MSEANDCRKAPECARAIVPTAKKELDQKITRQPLDPVARIGIVSDGLELGTYDDEVRRRLFASARAQVGMKSGCYVFEMKIKTCNLVDCQAPYARIGFSLDGSPAVLGETAESFGFDSEGYFWSDGSRQIQ